MTEFIYIPVPAEHVIEIYGVLASIGVSVPVPTKIQSNVVQLHQDEQWHRRAGRHKSHVWLWQILEYLSDGKLHSIKEVMRHFGMSKQAVYGHYHRHPDKILHQNGTLRRIYTRAQPRRAG